MVLTLLTGCAANHKYDYESNSISIPFKAKNQSTLILTVHDSRSYILDGNKQSDFVGFNRSIAYIPYNVNTKSGKPLTKAMSKSIVKGLENAGYKVIAWQENNIDKLIQEAKAQRASRIIVLEVNDWKSDLYLNIAMFVDLRLSVYDTNGKLLAESSIKFNKKIGPKLAGVEANGEIITYEFNKQVKMLLNQKTIKNAIKDSPAF